MKAAVEHSMTRKVCCPPSSAKMNGPLLMKRPTSPARCHGAKPAARASSNAVTRAITRLTVAHMTRAIENDIAPSGANAK